MTILYRKLFLTHELILKWSFSNMRVLKLFWNCKETFSCGLRCKYSVREFGNSLTSHAGVSVLDSCTIVWMDG